MPLTLAPSVIGFVSAQSGTGSTPKVISGITGTQAGRTYVAACTRAGALHQILSITDDGGNTWTRVHAAPTSGTVGKRTEQWITTAVAPFTSVTITYENTSNIFVTLLYLPGVNGLVDQSNGGFQAATLTPTVVPITPQVADTMAIGVIGYTTNIQSGVTVASPWTKISGGHANAPVIAYLLNPAVGVSVGPAWTGSSSQSSGQVVVNYKSTAVSTRPTIKRGTALHLLGVGANTTRTRYVIR